MPASVKLHSRRRRGTETVVITAWARRSFRCGVVIAGLIGRGLTAAPLDDLRPLVTTRHWTEHSTDDAGAVQAHAVTAEIWTAAFQRRIDETKRLEIPARSEP